MWSQFPLRLCMAAMAPALTDAAAHTGSFKLPASPANPGSIGGLQASPNQPTSPDLPSLANGDSPAVPGPDIIGKHFNRRSHEHTSTPTPTCFTVRSHFLENNNHKKGEAAVTRLTEEKSYQCLFDGNNREGSTSIQNKLNSLISTLGSGLELDLIANGERYSTIQSIQRTMNDSAASLTQKEVLKDNHTCNSPVSKMPPLTISATGNASPTGTKHSVAAHIESVDIRDNGDMSEHGELDTSDTSSSSFSTNITNDMDSSLSMSMSTTAITTDTSLEQAVEDNVDAKSDDEIDSDDSSVDLPVNIPAESPEACLKIECKEREGMDSDPHRQEEKKKYQNRLVDLPEGVKKQLFKVVIDDDLVSDEERKESSELEHSKQEHRAKYLMEKLRRLQTCHVGSRIYQQIGSFVESKQSSKEAPNSVASSMVACEECRRNRLQTGIRPGVLPRSSSSHSHTCPLHTNSSSDRQRNSARPSWLPAGKRTKPSTHISQHLREGKQAYREVKSVTGRLRASLGHVESTIDSDVTDSSSGGESCDEGDDSLPQSQASRSFYKMPLHRRASWKWAMDRSAIATRWTWLQAQVSDLEYRIRQQSDIFRQIRATKGSVILGEPPSPEEYLKAQALAHRTGRKLSPLESKIVMLEGSHSMSPSNLSNLLSNVDKQSANLKQSLQNCISPVSTSSTCMDKSSPARPINGLTDTAASVTTPSPQCGTNSSPTCAGIVGLDRLTGSPVPVEEQYCARTRPVKPFRKRKLTLRPYQACRKAQKLSTVHCGCPSPHTPCVMCRGRFNNLEHHDADQVPADERMASLDYAFHSVLSFPEEIPLAVHFESLLKSGAWQRKHSARSLGKKKHNRLQNRSRIKVHSKDGKLKKFRKKDKHHQQKQTTIRPSGDSARKHELVMKKEAKERSAFPLDHGVEKVKGSANEEEDDAAKSRKLLHRLARQKLKALREGRSDKFLSRSRSQPSSVPGTPKNIIKSSDTRQCRTDIKSRRTSDHLANAALEKGRERSLSLPNIEVGEHSSTPSTPASTEARSPTQQLSHSLPSASLHGILRNNKKGMLESYDIDNIVIPYSMLASTRVVKLNYKEIITPKWRELDMDEFMLNKHYSDEKDEDEDFFEENLSDSEFLERHESCECQEKQKFMVSFVDQGIPGRRSRRSRNNSIGSGTEPLSPDIHLEQLSTGRQSSTSSPTPSPSPITTPDQLSSSSTSSNVFNLSGIRSLRFSALNRRRSSSMSEVQTPKQVDAPAPLPGPATESTWVKREFPLNNDDMEDLATYPYPESEHSTRPSSRASNATHSESVVSRSESQEMNLYMSDGENSEGEAMEVDDPNDPEWTVVEDRQRSRKLEGSTVMEGLVLKLAKR